MAICRPSLSVAVFVPGSRRGGAVRRRRGCFSVHAGARRRCPSSVAVVAGRCRRRSSFCSSAGFSACSSVCFSVCFPFFGSVCFSVCSVHCKSYLVILCRDSVCIALLYCLSSLCCFCARAVDPQSLLCCLFLSMSLLWHEGSGPGAAICIVEASICRGRLRRSPAERTATPCNSSSFQKLVSPGESETRLAFLAQVPSK